MIEDSLSINMDYLQNLSEKCYKNAQRINKTHFTRCWVY